MAGLAVALGLPSGLPAEAGLEDRILPGPIPAEVLRIVDGDTVEVAATIWLGQRLVTLVRIEGVDAPELRGRCAREAALAAEARDFLGHRLRPGTKAALLAVQQDRHGGRVLARIRDAEGRDMGEALLAAALARPYDGSRRRSWCE